MVSMTRGRCGGGLGLVLLVTKPLSLERFRARVLALLLSESRITPRAPMEWRPEASRLKALTSVRLQMGPSNNVGAHSTNIPRTRILTRFPRPCGVAVHVVRTGEAPLGPEGLPRKRHNSSGSNSTRAGQT